MAIKIHKIEKSQVPHSHPATGFRDNISRRKLYEADIVFRIDDEHGVFTVIKDVKGRASVKRGPNVKQFMPTFKLSKIDEVESYLKAGDWLTKDRLKDWRSRDPLDTTFFVADAHFDHKRIIELCDRPWKDPVAFLAEYTDAHNWIVDERCTINWIGDFGFCDTKRAEQILSNLKGNHRLVYGNHDDNRVKRCAAWSSVKPYDEIKIAQRKVVMFHYPIYEWNGWHKGALHVYGHVHGNDSQAMRERGAVNVGVDVTGYRPMSAREAFDTMKRLRASASGIITK